MSKVMRDIFQLRQLFDATFDALPAKACEQIEGLWQKYAGVDPVDGDRVRFKPELRVETIVKNVNLATQLGPQHAISRALAETERLIQSLWTYGQTDGIAFSFKKAFVEKAPDEVLQILIAHELAHAHRAAEVGFKFPEA